MGKYADELKEKVQYYRENAELLYETNSSLGGHCLEVLEDNEEPDESYVIPEYLATPEAERLTKWYLENKENVDELIAGTLIDLLNIVVG